MEPRSREFKAQVLPTDDQIRERAYHIYLARAGAPGNPESDWIQAQRELTANVLRVATAVPAAVPEAQIAPKNGPAMAAPKTALDGVQQAPMVKTTSTSRQSPAPAAPATTSRKASRKGR